MTRYESNCVDCGLPCIFGSCPYYRVLHCYCDKCGHEEENLYKINDEQLCKDCLMNEMSIIDSDDADYCDECGNDAIDLFEYDDRHLCKNCLLEEFPLVNTDE